MFWMPDNVAPFAAAFVRKSEAEVLLSCGLYREPRIIIAKSFLPSEHAYTQLCFQVYDRAPQRNGNTARR